MGRLARNVTDEELLEFLSTKERLKAHGSTIAEAVAEVIQ